MKIISIPGVNGLGKTQGTRDSGREVFSALDSIRSSEKGKIINKNLLDFEEIELDNSNLEEQNKLVYKKALEEIKKNKVIFLGGDHSISYSIGKGFLDYCKDNQKEGFLIVFDAHADCMKPMKEPTHEEWLRGLIEYGFKPENIILIGARNKEKEEIKYIHEKKIKEINVEKINSEIEVVGDSITELSQGKELYVSIDIDVLDPAYVQATGYKEPGGLNIRELLYLVKRLSILKNLRAVDIVEINKEKEGAEDTLKIGAKIVGEFL